MIPSVSYIWICNVPNFSFVTRSFTHESLFFRFVSVTCSGIPVKIKSSHNLLLLINFKLGTLQFWTQLNELDNLVKLTYLGTKQKKRRDIVASRITPQLAAIHHWGRPWGWQLPSWQGRGSFHHEVLPPHGRQQWSSKYIFCNYSGHPCTIRKNFNALLILNIYWNVPIGQSNCPVIVVKN